VGVVGLLAGRPLDGRGEGAGRGDGGRGGGGDDGEGRGAVRKEGRGGEEAESVCVLGVETRKGTRQERERRRD